MVDSPIEHGMGSRWAAGRVLGSVGIVSDVPDDGVYGPLPPWLRRTRTSLDSRPALYPVGMPDEALLETTVDRKVIHTGRYLTFHVDTIADAQGRRHTRELVDHPGAVAVLALDDGELLMVRQYRTPIGRILLEIPAGTLDRLPDGSLEDPADAAPRELAEETGHAAATWRRLGRFYTAPGFASEEMHLFLATGLAPVPGYTGPDEDERLELCRVPWADAVELAEAGDVEDAKSILGLFWLDRLIRRGDVVP